VEKKMKYAKRHYIDIARILRENRERSGDNGIIDRIERQLAALFQSDNPRFDRAKFSAACAPGERDNGI
jgi:hypothetical protein